MSPTRTYCWSALALLLLQASLAAAQATPATSCPLTDFSRVDWSAAKPACSLAQPNAPAQGAFCDVCICALGQQLVTGLEAAGVQVDGQPISSLTTAAPTNGTDSGGGVTALLDACAPVLGLSLLQSGALTSAALTELTTKCDARAAGRACYETAVKTENGGPASPRVLAAAAPAASTAQAAAPARSGVDGHHGARATAAVVCAVATVAALLLL